MYNLQMTSDFCNIKRVKIEFVTCFRILTTSINWMDAESDHNFIKSRFGEILVKNYVGGGLFSNINLLE